MDWHAIDEGAGLWSAEYRVPGYPCRSSALRLTDGRLLVFSPGPGLEGGAADSLGDVGVLLAPNSFHHLGLPAWRERFPEATVVAAPGAPDPLARQGCTGVVALDCARALLPTHATLHEVPATRIGEAWLAVTTDRGVVWVVGDAIFNMLRLARRLRPRLIQRLTKAAPGLSMSQVMKWGGLTSRKRFGEWLVARIDADEPAVLVPLHGAVFDGPKLPDALRRLARERL